MLRGLFKKKNLFKGGIKKDFGFSRKIALFFLLFFLLAQFSVFAQITYSNEVKALENSGLEKILGNIVGFFTSVYMKAICIIALGGLGVGVLMNRGEPGMVKKFIPWIVGISILLSLTVIVDLVWTGTTASNTIK